MDVKIIESVIKSNELAIDELSVWKYLIKWAENQPGGLDCAKQALESLTPLVRFVSISADSFYEKVKPYKRFIPECLYEEAIWAYVQLTVKRSKKDLKDPRAKIIDSRYITLHHAALLSGWVDRKPTAYSTSQITDSRVFTMQDYEVFALQ
ncbi:9719_t:CDS:2 [Paraglomus brasilianum]|uniref:9719_t:CDS:1 n=1 Tax=Paraglomus brasilianum TaxID=144538 RepID=A0A9N8WS11_9GLOM|nr:9719_t:CDS:2 [Paraglomus brasilianum]